MTQFSKDFFKAKTKFSLKNFHSKDVGGSHSNSLKNLEIGIPKCYTFSNTFA